MLEILTEQKGLSVEDYESKRDVKYNFWARPTIPWKLECEEFKDEIISAAKDTAAVTHDTQTKATVILSAAIAGFALLCMLAQTVS